MKKLKIKQVDYLGLNHKKVSEKLSGSLTFCNYFCVCGEYQPVAVYKAKNPDKSKGHKKYVLLSKTIDGLLSIRGMTQIQMKQERIQAAVICNICNTLVYSVMRHHDNSCACGAISIDGGKDYTKLSLTDKTTTYKLIKFDLITNKVVK